MATANNNKMYYLWLISVTSLLIFKSRLQQFYMLLKNELIIFRRFKHIIQINNIVQVLSLNSVCHINRRSSLTFIGCDIDTHS